MATTLVIPVDLNAFVLKVKLRNLQIFIDSLICIKHVHDITHAIFLAAQMELDITSLANSIGDSITAEYFREASEARKKAINSIFWNTEMQQWLDYWLNDSIPLKVISFQFTVINE